MQRRRGPQMDLLILLCCWLCCPTPGEAFFSLSSIPPALERAANYGYSMLGYAPPSYGYGDDLEIYEKAPVWDGHIPVGDIVSPLLSALGANGGLDSILGVDDGYGNRERVVKGYDNRLGLRVALPYVGDFQVTREIGPGRFLDKLGPGKYPYSHLPPKSKGHGGHGGGYPQGQGGYGYEPAPTKGFLKKPLFKGHHGSTIPDNKGVYQSLQNYPWYAR